MPEKTLRVLIIDDSAYNRNTIRGILQDIPGVTVVGVAEDGEKGLKEAMRLKPDLVTLDVEMPRMDGFTCLRLLMSQMPTPVIVISTHSRKHEVFQALELGALDFIAKPDRFFGEDHQKLRTELMGKVRAVLSLQVAPFQQTGQRARSVKLDGEKAHETETPKDGAKQLGSSNVRRIVCIGSSTGGPPALQSLVKTMAWTPGTTLLIAQHMPEKFTTAFAERLNRLSALNIVEAADGTVLREGTAYISPGAHHLEIVAGENGEFVTKVSSAENADHYSPSIDRLFSSVAGQFTGEILGVILTGMGNDGAGGVRAIREAGGINVAESRDTAIVFGMPKEAIATQCVDEVLPLDKIIERIVNFGGNA